MAAAAHAIAAGPLTSRYQSTPHAPLVTSETAFLSAGTMALPPAATANVVSKTDAV